MSEKKNSKEIKQNGAVSDIQSAFEQLNSIFNDKEGPLAKLNEVFTEINDSNLSNILENFNIRTEKRDNEDSKEKRQEEKGPKKDNPKNEGKFHIYKKWNENGVDLFINGASQDDLYGLWKATLTISRVQDNFKLCGIVDMDFKIEKAGLGKLTGNVVIKSSLFGVCIPTIPELGFDFKITGTTKLLENGDHWDLVFDTQCIDLKNKLEIHGPSFDVSSPLPFGMWCGDSWTFTCEILKLQGVLSKVENFQMDLLPIIPRDSTADDKNRLLYNQKMKLTLTKEGKPVSGMEVEITSSRGKDVDIIKDITPNENGEIFFTVETRESGETEISVSDKNNEICVPPLTIQFIEAWYEELFEVTKYYIPIEKEFLSGKDPNNSNNLEMEKDGRLKGNHNKAFLDATKLNGTGRAVGEEGEEFYVDYNFEKKPRGKEYNARKGKVERFKTIAADPRVIPFGHRVYIKPLGDVTMVDVGSAVLLHHIDYFVGEGIDEYKSIDNLGTEQRIPERYRTRKKPELFKHWYAPVKYLGAP